MIRHLHIWVQSNHLRGIGVKNLVISELNNSPEGFDSFVGVLECCSESLVKSHELFFLNVRELKGLRS